jgi:1-deoxy-D-xylulose-5-phosphate synthase
MKYLDKLNFPDDLKKLKESELNLIAAEIREFLINSIAKTGGHLSSNLGVVELTVALHYCFNFSYDRIIWDVGHQSYTHKILTGRKNEFNSLRKKDGLSGFPKSEESIYDSFNTGHSSTSISAGLGIAQARNLSGGGYNVVSVIGDGSMTGGLVYEALNNAARSDGKFIIILNDNQMSISKNVGAMSKYLTELRSAPKYIEVKKDVSELLNSLPIFGSKMIKILEKTKDGIKYALLPSVMFEQLGVKYIGPVDGHDIGNLINVFNKVKKFDKPVLIHLLTTKGKGYKNAEKYPSKFHGIGSFDVTTGIPLSEKEGETYSEIFGKTMCKLSAKNKKIVAITAAMPSGTGLEFFSKAYPSRFFDVGIAESHAVTFSAGLAKGGFTPVFTVYSTFLQRGYDQIIHDVCIQKLHVVFAVDRAGIVGDDG